MHVTVDLTSQPSAVTLVEPDDCARFDVVVHGPGDAEDLDRALAAWSAGRLEGPDALVAVAAVRRLAAGTVGEGWEADFVGMLGYARGRGWLTDDEELIRAHVEWQ